MRKRCKKLVIEAPMEGKILQPSKNPLDIKGSISYREADQAWNIIKFKKEFLNEFSALREKRSNFSYQMLFYRTYDELERLVRKMKGEKSPLPILLFLQKDQLIK